MRFLIFILMLFPRDAYSYHPIHVSVCNIELSGVNNIVSVKLFKDDFALALKNAYEIDIPMEKADEPANQKVISKYINECLQISSDKGRLMKLEYKNSEINEDAIWFYFSTEKLNSEKLVVKNTLMLDLWDDQTNLLIIAKNGDEKGYRFNKRETETKIDLTN